MNEITVIFFFKGKESKYKVKKEELKKILSKYSSDIGANKEELTFMCNGRKIQEGTLQQISKKINQINITVYPQVLKLLSFKNFKINQNQNEKDKKEKEERLKEIIKNQFNRKLPEKNEEKIKLVLEDMCAMGKIVKEQILEEKKKNPEKFISIEEATKKENQNSDLFCLGLLAKNLEEQGMITAIERQKSDKEEDQMAANVTLQFLFNGMATEKKFGLNFELGYKRNNELLTNKAEQEKFNEKLKNKLSKE